MRLAKVTSLFVHPNVLANALPVAKELGIKNENIYILGGHVKGRKSFSDFVRLARVKKMKRLELRSAKKDTLACMFYLTYLRCSLGDTDYDLSLFRLGVLKRNEWSTEGCHDIARKRLLLAHSIHSCRSGGTSRVHGKYHRS